jgi:ABC-2 type transport system permease protein
VTWLLFPFVVVFIAVFAFGVAMLLSSLFIPFRDVDPIWDVIVQAMFYASGIFFTVSSIGDKLPSWISQETVVRILFSNPFAAALQEARHLLVSPSYPTVSSAMGGLAWVLIPLGITVVLVAIGYRVFTRLAPTIAEDL